MPVQEGGAATGGEYLAKVLQKYIGSTIAMYCTMGAGIAALQMMIPDEDINKQMMIPDEDINKNTQGAARCKAHRLYRCPIASRACACPRCPAQTRDAALRRNKHKLKTKQTTKSLGNWALLRDGRILTCSHSDGAFKPSAPQHRAVGTA